MNTLGKIIKELRTNRGMSQHDLAKAAGMGQSDISKLERGTMSETTAIVRLAMALDVSPIYLETQDKKYAGLSAFDIVGPGQLRQMMYLCQSQTRRHLWGTAENSLISNK